MDDGSSTQYSWEQRRSEIRCRVAERITGLRKAEQQFVVLFVIRLLDAFVQDELWRLDLWLSDMRQTRLDVDFDALIALGCEHVMPIVTEVLGESVAGKLVGQVVGPLERGDIASSSLVHEARTQAHVLLARRFHGRPELKQRAFRVSQTAGEIARRMFVGAFHLQRIEIAGLIYDIGKTCLDPAVLESTTPLSPEQWGHVQEHVVLGERIIRSVPAFAALDLADAARCHHERFDGFGYPDGLSGSAIPLAARIVGLADAYHAMLAQRPYAGPVALPAVRKAIADGAGRQWDPSVTTALLDIIDAGAERPAVKALASRVAV